MNLERSTPPLLSSSCRSPHRVALLRPAAVLCAITVGAGCSVTLLRVEPDALAKIAPADRRQVEDRDGKPLAAAREQLARAAVELDEARRAAQAGAADPTAAEATRRARAALAAATKSGEQRAIDQAQLDKVVAEEGERLQRVKNEWLAAQLAWRTRVHEAAERRVQASEAKLELSRAELIARHAPADDPFDLAPYRGQQGRTHQAWSESTARVATAHAEVDRLAGELAAAKARYAMARKVVLPKALVADEGAPTGSTPNIPPPPATPAAR